MWGHSKKDCSKEKELASADKNYRNEEAKLNKKAADAEKKRIQDAARQSAAMEQAILPSRTASSPNANAA